MKTFVSTLFAAALALSVPLLRADDSTANIKFSDPSKPGTIKIIIPRGDVHISGSAEADVTVKSEAKAITSEPRADGLRVLSASSSYTLNEKGNVITLDASNESMSGGSSDLNVTVPRNTSVIVTNAWGGDVSCKAISGDLEIKSLNGEIDLEEIGGAVLVETMNGEIKASLAQVRENKPLSFTSMNGEVVLRVPADAKANVKLRTRNGSILTDFDDKTLVTTLQVSSRGKRSGKGGANDGQWQSEVRDAVREAVRGAAEAAREAASAAREAAKAAHEGATEAEDPEEPMTPMPPMAPLPPVTGGKIVAGALNGGGAEIAITTMNGDVTLRKK